MAKIDTLGLIGNLMVGGSDAYFKGAALDRDKERQESQNAHDLTIAQMKQDGLLRLENWRAERESKDSGQEHKYKMEEQAANFASKERIAGVGKSNAKSKAGAKSGKERVEGVAGLRADYKKFIENDFDSGAEDGWWFTDIGSKEGSETPTFEEWAHRARPEEANYYGVAGGAKRPQGGTELEGTVADIIRRANLGGGAGGDVAQPSPIAYDEPPREIKSPRPGIITEAQRDQGEGLREYSPAGERKKFGEDIENLKGKARGVAKGVAGAASKVADFARGSSPEDRVQAMPGFTAREIVKSAGLPKGTAEKLMANPAVAWEINKAIKANDKERLAELIKQL